ncbi:MAG: class I SAM-dependent methyltransferase [Methylococcales bacterium]|nr:class I SAM-dependent methyltransferase [Methylococcales bacterium]
MDSETASIPCNLCGKRDVSVLACRSRGGGPLRTVICNCCGLVWSDPFPYEPRQFYENDYRLEYKKTCAPKPKHVLRAGKVALTRLHKIRHLLASRQTMLDVGTGGGEFAYLLKSLGHDLYGVEPNKGYAEYSAAEYALNLQIGFIQDAHFTAQSFDIITIWHVLEHTEDPGFVLGILHGLLKPQGVLVVEVPNVEAMCQSPSSVFHEAHLFNFNLVTLIRLGEKTGFSVDSHLFSDDQGNITLFFRKAETAAMQAAELDFGDNADRIIGLVRGHSQVKHYLTLTPYRRFLLRMYRTASEKFSVRGYDSNKSLLDRLYQGRIQANKA